MKISLIAAIGRNRELGKNGKMPWHISEDFKRFKAITSRHPIIMGRKTWESLPTKPLPNRLNIVITRNPSFSFAGGGPAKLAGNLDEAIRIAKKESGGDEIFVIGGGQIFEQAIGLADKLYLTVIDASFDADTFFPDYSEFKIKKIFGKGESGEFVYEFQELER